MSDDQRYMHWIKPYGPWLARWKEGPTWRSKKVPVSLTDERDAEEWFARWLATRQLAVPPPPPPQTMLALAQRWVRWLKDKPNAGPNAYDAAERVSRLWLAPFRLAAVDSSRLTLRDCVDWVEDVQRKADAPLTVRNVVQQLRTLLSDARGKGWRDGENFFNDKFVKDMTRGAKTQRETVALTVEQVRLVVSYEGTDVVPLRHTRNVVGLTTGLRHAEIAGLRWSDVRLDDDVPHLRVDRQLVARGSSLTAPVFRAPKKGSNRHVPLHRVAVPVLRQWLEEGWTQWVGRSPNDEDPVFPDVEGRWVYGDYASQFRVDLGHYGLPCVIDGQPVRFHDVRSTLLTLLTDADVPEGDVKAVAGHAAPNVTRRHYVRKNIERIARGVNSVPLATETKPRPSS